jgi:hypothetical protein
MILLWGIREDTPMSFVHRALERLGAPAFFLNQSEFLGTEIEVISGSSMAGTLRADGRLLKLDDISSAYIRPHETPLLPGLEDAGPGSVVWSHASRLEDALLCWTELTSALVVNRPSTMSSNNSKPFQSALIRSFGLEIPETLITTDPQAALAFWSEHESVIYKSISGVRSIVSRLDKSHYDRIKNVANCPTQFQEYIAGRDYRLHLVGSEPFAAEIISDADDYRYTNRTGDSVKIRPITLPPDLVDRCRGLTTSLGLHFAGIDLRQNPEGKWYCFEVNPSPGFSFYEQNTGQPISDAVARMLIDG